jgi:hypothetical protein
MQQSSNQFSILLQQLPVGKRGSITRETLLSPQSSNSEITNFSQQMNTVIRMM